MGTELAASRAWAEHSAHLRPPIQILTLSLSVPGDPTASAFSRSGSAAQMAHASRNTYVSTSRVERSATGFARLFGCCSDSCLRVAREGALC
ncbi:hypothetical protein FB451DRAFT_1558046 [Mycena latifolia]|nr:hypothetical protein FB451DRAFT_1558046 [Mycena latifolia]